MNIVIYGKPDCERCEQAKTVFGGEAQYREHGSLWDDYDSDTAVEIATAKSS